MRPQPWPLCRPALLHRRRVIHLLAPLVAGLLALAMTAAAVRAEGRVTVIDNIAIDATGEDATAARQAAILQGLKAAIVEGFRELAASPGPLGEVPISDAEINRTVLDFEVLNPRNTADRFLATMNVRLRTDQLEALFNTKNLKVSQAARAPVLVVPLLRRPMATLEAAAALQQAEAAGLAGGAAPVATAPEAAAAEDADPLPDVAVDPETGVPYALPEGEEAAALAEATPEPTPPPAAAAAAGPVQPLPIDASGVLLWQPENPWLLAWTRHGAVTGLLPMVMPLGDIQDLDALPVEAAIGRNEAALERLAGRYGAGGALLVEAIPVGRREGTGDLPEALRITTERYGVDGLIRRLDLTVDSVPGETAQQLYDRARQVVIAALQEDWRRGNQEDAQLYTLSVHVQLNALSDWIRLKERLRGIARVRDVRADSLSASQARLVLVHAGQLARLRETLREQSLTLGEQPEPLPGSGNRSTGYEPSRSYPMRVN